MSEFNSYIAQLLLKRTRDELLNPSEAEDLISWQEQSDDRLRILDPFKDDDWVADNLEILESAPSEEMWDNLSAHAGRRGLLRRIFSRPRMRWVAAAVIILIGVSTYYWYNHRLVGNLDTKGSGVVKSVAANTDKGNVFLTLADGSQVVLDGKADNRVVYTGNYSGATKKEGNTLIYQATLKPADNAEMVYHTVTTRKAPAFILVLPDGSKVWLNNASSIRYPVFFKGNEREVELTGQAYFEVVGDRSRPFEIKIGKTLVEALGTRFDIMAYPDEPAGKITLLDGSVRVGNGVKRVAIQPLQQVLIKGDRLEKMPLKHPDEVLAWHRNEFRFDHTDLMTAMRQIARWYQLDLENKDGVKGKPIAGSMSRDMSVNELLMAIEKAEDGRAYFSTEGNSIKISATPKR